MKKHTILATLALAGVAMLAACSGNNTGFKTTDGGLQYRFETLNADEQPVNDGDVIVGEMTIRFNSDTLFSNQGHPERIFRPTANAMTAGDLNEGLLLMHRGDRATFAVSADTVARFLERRQMPRGYEPGKGQMFYYDINVVDIVTSDEYNQEEENARAEERARRDNEPALIAEYISDNGITAKPNADGLYIVVKKMGKGPKVAMGRTVQMNYTGRLLDGTMFDSSVEADAREGGIFDARATYQPLTYEVGRMGLIKGWEDGVSGMPEGTQLQLIIPSALGYGPQSRGERLPSFSPLVFDIEIVSVN